MKSQIEVKMRELQKIPGLFEFVMEHAFLAGGAVRDLARNKTPKDWDIFFKSEDAKNEFVKRFSSGMVETGIGNFNYANFQFITIRWGTPEEVINTFDWNVNMLYYDFLRERARNGAVWGFYDGVYLKINTNAEKPLASLLRLPYLIEKGFRIEQDELLFALSFVSKAVNLQSSESVMDQAEFMSACGGPTGKIDDTIKRASEAAIKHSPLYKAML
jgi:hypothetical protein